MNAVNKKDLTHLKSWNGLKKVYVLALKAKNNKEINLSLFGVCIKIKCVLKVFLVPSNIDTILLFKQKLAGNSFKN